MKNKRIAILDLGTNTFHLLIAEILPDQEVKIICKDYRAVKLGEGGITKGFITNEAIQRGLTALNDYKTIINEALADEIKAVATSAIRDAINGDEFIQTVLKKTQIQIEVINGDREAELIYKGVRAATKFGNSCALIMDIGGGSVEFIIANDQEVFWKKSFPIGAARLMEQYHHTDPISETDINDIHQHLTETLTELLQQIMIYKPDKLIGSAGAFETYADIIADAYHLPADIPEQPALVFDTLQLKQTLQNILLSNHQQRIETAGIIPLRVDMIVVAAVLTQYVMNITGIDNVILSTFALREGVLYDMLNS
jgi:exopolyphosphatase/guanosine-5'-triphosphate,3'-diphosphate pyrophosphatase